MSKTEKQNKIPVQLVQSTKVDGDPMDITFTMEEATADSWILEQLVRLGLASWTYRTKTKLKELQLETISFAALRDLWLSGGGESVAVDCIDLAAQNLRKAGLKVPSRPKKEKGKVGGESPTTWARRIKIPAALAERLVKIATAFGYHSKQFTNVAEYAAMLEWKQRKDEAAARAAQAALFLSDEDEETTEETN